MRQPFTQLKDRLFSPNILGMSYTWSHVVQENYLQYVCKEENYLHYDNSVFGKLQSDPRPVGHISLEEN